MSFSLRRNERLIFYYLVLLSLIYPNAQSSLAQWQINDTEVYRPFAFHEVVIHANGEVYFFETGKSTIQHYGRDGVFKGTIGRKGSGPGELQRVIRVFYRATTAELFVLDATLSRLQVFQSNGRFVETIKFPRNQLIFPAQTKYGWYYPRFTQRATKEELFITDFRFKKTKLVSSWQRPPITLNGNAGETTVKADIAVDAGRTTASADGSLLYLYFPGKPQIKLLDAETGVEQGVIELDLKPLPIADAWVEKKLADTEKIKTPIKLEYTVGEHFPLVKKLRTGPLGNLLVYTSIHFVKEELPPLVFNPQGQEVTTPFSGAALKRIVGVHENMAYVTTFDRENEEAGLALVKLADVNQFVASRP